MSVSSVINEYYALANRGEWDAWCDLFHPSLVMEEQLAGRVEGIAALREMMKGFGADLDSFANEPQHIVIGDDGEQAAVVSRLSLLSKKGDRIEVGVVNYFRIVGDQILYFANFHDTAPFRVLSEV
jgi:ketosteroid isomerase-like protein